MIASIWTALAMVAVASIAVLVSALASGLFAKPVAPKVPDHVIAGATIRIEDGGSSKLMLMLHPLQFQVAILKNGKWQQIAESKETKKHRWHWTVPLNIVGERLRFTATNECPVTDWDSSKSPGTERTVEAA